MLVPNTLIGGSQLCRSVVQWCFRLRTDSLPRLCGLKDVAKTVAEARLLVVRGAGELLASVLQSGGAGESRGREVEGSLFLTGHGGNGLTAASGH